MEGHDVGGLERGVELGLAVEVDNNVDRPDSTLEDLDGDRSVVVLALVHDAEAAHTQDISGGELNQAEREDAKRGLALERR
jgi:hypothetical protein